MRSQHDRVWSIVQEFATHLGWRRLKPYVHIIDDPERNEDWGEAIRYYVDESTESLSLHINESPYWVAAVYAVDRYRLFTGWHAFRLCTDSTRLKEEVARLEPMLHRRNFTSPESRRMLRIRYPDMANQTWPVLRSKHAPYFNRDGQRIPHPAEARK